MSATIPWGTSRPLVPVSCHARRDSATDATLLGGRDMENKRALTEDKGYSVATTPPCAHSPSLTSDANKATGVIGSEILKCHPTARSEGESLSVERLTSALEYYAASDREILLVEEWYGRPLIHPGLLEPLSNSAEVPHDSYERFMSEAMRQIATTPDLLLDFAAVPSADVPPNQAPLSNAEKRHSHDAVPSMPPPMPSTETPKYGGGAEHSARRAGSFVRSPGYLAPAASNSTTPSSAHYSSHTTPATSPEAVDGPSRIPTTGPMRTEHHSHKSNNTPYARRPAPAKVAPTEVKPAAPSGSCTSVGRLSKDELDKILKEAKALAERADAETTVRCSWNGCTDDVEVGELPNHLRAQHGVAFSRKSEKGRARCLWGACTKELVGMQEHVRGHGRRALDVRHPAKCPTCAEEFLPHGLLKGHLMGVSRVDIGRFR